MPPPVTRRPRRRKRRSSRSRPRKRTRPPSPAEVARPRMARPLPIRQSRPNLGTKSPKASPPRRSLPWIRAALPLVRRSRRSRLCPEMPPVPKKRRSSIAEIENSELTMSRVQKLAALYTVKNQKLVEAQPEEPKISTQGNVRYYAAAESPKKAVTSGSEFLRAVSSVKAEDALAVLDELMSALYVANPKVYNGVMRKLERLQNE